jgi:hypothetical protein
MSASILRSAGFVIALSSLATAATTFVSPPESMQTLWQFICLVMVGIGSIVFSRLPRERRQKWEIERDT